MEYLGIKSSRDIDSFFENNGVNNLYAYTKVDQLPIRIGYAFIEDLFVIKYLAIQMDNSTTNDTFELIEIDIIQTSSDKEMEDLACQFADKIVRYNKDIIQYYKGHC